MKDEYVIVLDFLPSGHSLGRREPIAQAIGEKYFSLLELIIRKDVTVKHGDRLYIGNDDRKEVDHIKRRINMKGLTNFAKSELEYVVKKIVDADEERFVKFFNMAQPISTRLHQLELLPGIGKKHMWHLIDEKEKGDFKSFKDLSERVKLLPDPKEMIIKRIMKEIENDHERFRLFVLRFVRRY